MQVYLTTHYPEFTLIERGESEDAENKLILDGAKYLPGNANTYKAHVPGTDNTYKSNAAGGSGTCYGNGTKYAVLGYAIQSKTDSTRDYVEAAQMR